MKTRNKASWLTFGLMTLMASSFLALNAPSAIGQAAAAPAATKSLHLTATVNPNTPRVGDNTLDIQIADASGQPVSGLKLSTRVEMASMDMGTAHPAVKAMGNGHYRTTVNFSMAGPWRVTLRAGSGKAVLDFDAGGKSAWKSSTVSLTLSDSGPATKPSGASQTPSATPHPAQTPGMADNLPNASKSGDGMAGMDISDSAVGGMKMDGGATHADMDMKPLKMPQLQEQGTYVATGHENWKMRTMFGNNAGMVGMMTQMMVGGSGMEGMKMPAMKMNFDEQNFTEDADDADANSSATSSGGMNGMSMDNGSNGNMPAMPMGSSGSGHNTSPPSQASPDHAQPPSGKKGSSSDSVDGMNMPGMKMPSMGSAPSKAPASLKISGTIANPKSGDNTLTITVTDASGAPITRAKITTSVAMTSMDMGTTHPPVKELGGGKYQSAVNFSMSGPWRVTINVIPLGGGQPQKKTFVFDAK